MVLLFTFIALELLLLLNVVMFIDGRREAPSVWIRNDFLLAIVANIAVTLLIFSIGGLYTSVTEMLVQGFEPSWLLAIAVSVGVTWFALMRVMPEMRIVRAAELARAAAAVLPSVPDLVVPSPGMGAKGPLPG